MLKQAIQLSPHFLEALYILADTLSGFLFVLKYPYL